MQKDEFKASLEYVKKLSKTKQLSVVVHTFNPSTRETEVGRYLYLQGQHDLHSEFQVSQGQHSETLSQQDRHQQ